MPVKTFLTQIKELEQTIKRSQRQIKILKTKRKLEVLENGGDLCSTCNGVLEFKYGNNSSDYFWARCEDCKQTNMKRAAEWTDDPETWPKSKG